MNLKRYSNQKTNLVFFFFVALLFAESLALFLLFLFSLFFTLVVEVTDVAFKFVCWAHEGHPAEVGGVDVEAKSWTSSWWNSCGKLRSPCWKPNITYKIKFKKNERWKFRHKQIADSIPIILGWSENFLSFQLALWLQLVSNWAPSFAIFFFNTQGIIERTSARSGTLATSGLRFIGEFRFI